ncbi:hypothetical protein CR152_15895 [Massilia violaceinigra]|uniref:Schlafen AlbA-2 domain-containing protein n=1 Tax=Massilia violaceinigra TaxID=2045208 RepID=A0A2D2DLI8_9BURK|nr:ATP-binding protein [Massilia violaceinigra]ATQ75843.1 hypothetical protein CR152_15895 [Massilia violaceinigra]
MAAFANTSGGEIYIGIEEMVDLNRKYRLWRGFEDQEAANPVFQVLEQMNPLGNNYVAEFLRFPDAPGIVLHLTIFKTKDMVAASDGRCYVRRNAQSLPVSGDDALERLRYDKGIKSFEDEL